jgi:hypothetical protein
LINELSKIEGSNPLHFLADIPFGVEEKLLEGRLISREEDI